MVNERINRDSYRDNIEWAAGGAGAGMRHAIDHVVHPRYVLNPRGTQQCCEMRELVV
jgi:hypothetical protein